MWPDCQHDSTGLALLQGAKEHPQELDRRLILADWLEDQGEGEVAQCLRRSVRDPDVWIDFPAVVVRRWEPLSGCWLGWVGTECGPQDLSDSPWSGVWWCPVGRLSLDEVKWVAGSPRLASVVSLHLWASEIGDVGTTTLVASPHLAGLVYLALWSNQIGDEGAAALANASHLTNLTDLDLWSNQIGSVGAAALAGSSDLTNLTHLNLSENQITDEGAAALAGSPYLTNLTSLNLGYNGIDDAGVEALSRSSHLARLTTLELAGNLYGFRGQAALDQLRQRGVTVNT